MGAWIETTGSSTYTPVKMSHPTWVRGLKLGVNIRLLVLLWSHPTWVRGLKQDVDADSDAFVSRTLRGCVD